MLVVMLAVYLSQAVQAVPCAGLPPGKHSLLERFTEQFTLTCEQQLKIEPLLHAEESVSKPLLAFAAFTPEEQAGVMLKVKVAARRQVRELLTPEQQKLMDGEIDSVRKAGKKGAGKKAPPKVDPYENEEALSLAVMNYAALSPDEKKAIVQQVKQAAVKDDSLGLTPEQRKKIEADLKK
jgi:hypothetical protein